MSLNTPDVIRALRSGRVVWRPFTIATPAAGVGFSFTVDSLGWLQLISVRFNYVSSAVVANRAVHLDYQDGDGNDFARFPAAGFVTASITPTILFLGDYGVTNATMQQALAAPLGDWPLMPGWKVVVSVAGIDAADQISGIRVTALDWETLTSDQLALADQMEGQ